MAAAILEARRQHPTWGAKKLLACLSRRDPTRPWPSRSACCATLARHGLIHKPRRRRPPGHPGRPSALISAPNEVRSADFKGQFKVSVTCAGEYVGLAEVDDGRWDVYFGPLRLGRLLEREMRIEDASGKLWRHRKRV